jgi:hypothetical protein
MSSYWWLLPTNNGLIGVTVASFARRRNHRWLANRNVLPGLSPVQTAKTSNGALYRGMIWSIKAPALSQVLTAIWHRPTYPSFDQCLLQLLHGLIEMAWYDVFVLWIWWCWERIRPFISTRRNGWNEDDLTSLTNKMPVFEDKIIVSTVNDIASIS